MTLVSVFLSFSISDSPLAIALRDGLQARGIAVWKAPESIPPGVDWAAAIHAGLHQQQVFLLLWTDAAMASANVSKEINLAIQHHRLILPLKLTAALPSGGQAYHLSTIQWLDGQGLPLPVLLDAVEARCRELVQQGAQVMVSAPPAPWASRSRPVLRRGFQPLLALLALAALASDLAPWSAPNQWLLNQRLFWQARWRQITAQSGPAPGPIGLLPLTLPLYEQWGVQPTAGSVNQAVLAKALQALPPDGPPQRVGLDFILDGPGANVPGHRALAEAIRRQRGRRQLLAGLCPSDSQPSADCLKAGDQRLAPQLAAAGAQAVSLGLGVLTNSQPPLQLVQGIGRGSLARAMAGAAPRGDLPADAVIDWSVNWLSPQRLTLIRNLYALARYRGGSLLIASDGYGGERLNQVADQHPVPEAVWAYDGQGPQRFATSLQRGALPGGVIHAVLAQSISAGHWLEPAVPLMPTTLSTAAVAALAWFAARRDQRSRLLLAGVGCGAILYTLLALQLAVSLRRLLPIALPLSAAAAIVGLQRSTRLRP